MGKEGAIPGKMEHRYNKESGEIDIRSTNKNKK